MKRNEAKRYDEQKKSERTQQKKKKRYEKLHFYKDFQKIHRNKNSNSSAENYM